MAALARRIDRLFHCGLALFLATLAVLSVLSLPDAAEAQRGRGRARIERQLEAEEGDVAREHFFAGVTLYESGDREGALEEFRASFEARAEPVVAYNIAQVLRESRAYEEAIDWYGRYLALGGESITRQRRREVALMVRRLDRLLVPVSITVVPEGAELRVDSRLVGQAPFAEPVRLSRGTRHFVLSAAGHRPLEVDVRIAGRRPIVLEYALEVEETESTLVLTADPPTAVLLVDGVEVGEGEAQAAVESGGHVIEARVEGYSPYRTAVSVAERQELELHLALSRHEEPWETWWFWTIFGVVIAGAAAGITAGVLASQ